MFDNVNKTSVLQQKIKNIKLVKFDLNNKILLTVYT